jgi:hypothetical protein
LIVRYHVVTLEPVATPPTAAAANAATIKRPRASQRFIGGIERGTDGERKRRRERVVDVASGAGVGEEGGSETLPYFFWKG